MDEWNYFNYFTEIEEYFWKKRGTNLLVSPLDWAIMETWQKAGVPLDAVFKGIDKAFESYGRSRRGAGKPLKSLAYCTDAVLDAAEEAQEAAAGKAPANSARKNSSFDRDEVRKYFERNADALKNATNSAESTPIARPRRISPGRPPATRATPGTTAAPISNSRGSKRRPATQGSTMARNTGHKAMHVAATDALASLIAP